MNSNKLHFLTPKALLALVALAGSLAAPLLQAQQVYRIVGPDGKVTFSDRPPVASSAASAKISEAGNSTPESASASLPYELRQIVLKYPVVLYTGDNCVPCGAGRSMLTSRGVPFSEKTVTTAADVEALQRMSGETSLPFLTIGSQQLKGFSDAEWTQFLNAASYPKSSTLPTGFRQPAPSPLVVVAAVPANAPASEGAETKTINGMPAARSAPPPANSGNPAGIKF